MLKAHRRKRRLILLVVGILLIIFLFTALDSRLTVRYYSVSSEKLSGNIRVVMISDLHSALFVKNQSELIQKVIELKPDAVLFVGDLCDDWSKRDRAEDLLRGITPLYPCYYVTGNHEYWTGKSDEILSLFSKYDLTVLNGKSDVLSVNGQEINICGITDSAAPYYSDMKQTTEQQLDDLADVCADGRFTLLMAHRPEFFETYLRYDFDLVLSAHAHGGQWRIPGLINGVYSPNQGWFPKYAGGRYEESDTVMIVGRGLGNNGGIVPRIYNPPEIVVVDINSPQ